MFKKGDIILIVVLITVVACGFAGMSIYRKLNVGTEKIAVIKKDNDVLYRINLNEVDEPRRIIIDGDYNNTLLVENGRIRYEESDCPDKVCVRTGWIEYDGNTAVCIPNKTIIKIESETADIDTQLR